MKKNEVTERVINLVCRVDESINKEFEVMLSHGNKDIAALIVVLSGKPTGIYIAPRLYHRYDPARLDALVVHELSNLGYPISDLQIEYSKKLGECEHTDPEMQKKWRLSIRYEYEIIQKLLVEMTERKLNVDRSAIETLKKLELNSEGYLRFLRTEQNLTRISIENKLRKHLHMIAFDARIMHAEDVIRGEASTGAYVRSFSVQFDERVS